MDAYKNGTRTQYCNYFYNLDQFNSIAIPNLNENDPNRAQRASACIEYGYWISETRALAFPQIFAHGNSKNEIGQTD